MAEMVKAKLNGQFEITLPKHRADRPDWYTEEGWEKARLDRLHGEIKWQLSKKIQPVVYYVGAEEGEMPALCQMWGAKVVMFEPNPLVFPNIKAIWDANKLDAPEGIYVGFASASTEENPAHLNPAITGKEIDGWPECAYGDVIGNHGFKELYQESDAFPQVKIDDYVARTGLVPTIISFDVEGSEWQVMRGATDTLKDYKPTIFASISPEFMFHQFGEYSRDLRNWIIDKGYKETILDYQHELHTLYTPKARKDENTSR
jgi:FkbM family methyltransferase